jgi:predicted Zn-dependent protease
VKFSPKHIEDNVNVSKTHPLAELGWLVGGLLLLVFVCYLALGLATNIAVAKIPIKAETWLGEKFIGRLEALTNQPLQENLQRLLDKLPADSALHQYNFHVQLVKSDEINALAMPGGHIVVFSGLVEQAESENELAMILAHELGHYANRDHLRRLGRGLGLTVATFLLFGENSAASDLASKFFLVSESHYSREQEASADRFGLDLLVASYGHAGGATDFFARVGQKVGSQAPYLLASHPHPQARIDELEELIREKNYLVKSTIPVKADLIELLPEKETENQAGSTAIKD